MSDRRWALGWLLLAAGCGNELQLEPAAEQEVEGRRAVEVRTRPVCGDGKVGVGEECDDGNAVPDDGCDGRCQAPCAEGTLPVVGCGPGRSFVDELELYSISRSEWVEAPTSRDTQICQTLDGVSFEVAVCRSGNCINILPPTGGGRVCSSECVVTADCREGEVCVEMWADGPALSTDRERRPAGPQEVGGRCLPAVGAGIGARCGTCGEGLDCNQVSGAESLFICMPKCETSADCPPGAQCAEAYSVHTGDPAGSSCFHGVSDDPGALPETPDNCERGATLPTAVTIETCDAGCERLYGCDLCFTDDTGACRPQSWCRAQCLEGAFPYFACINERGCESAELCEGAQVNERVYCSRECLADSDCPDGWQCLDYEDVGGRCVAPGPAAFFTPGDFVVVESRTFPDPGCPADVDETCTFESACDPDCRRTTGCGEVAEAGGCQADTLRFCQQHNVISIDCAARGLSCGFDPGLARFDCLGASQ